MVNATTVAPEQRRIPNRENIAQLRKKTLNGQHSTSMAEMVSGIQNTKYLNSIDKKKSPPTRCKQSKHSLKIGIAVAFLFWLEVGLERSLTLSYIINR